METLLQDIRYSARALLKRPLFTIVATLTLTLGIGANTAIFSVVNAVLLRPLPYDDADRLLMIWENDTLEGNPRNPLAPANFVDFRDQNHTFEQVAFFTNPSGANVTGGDEPERIMSTAVSANFFSLLGTEPLLGRGFLANDAKDEAEPVAVLSHGLWQRRFGKDPDVLGKEMMVEGIKYTVVGVMPASFRLPDTVEMWGPMPLEGSDAANRRGHFLNMIGRLAPGVTGDQARADLTTIAGQLEQQYPDTNTGRSVTLVTLQDQLVGDVRPALLVLLGAVAFVLLIACANVANLSLARGAARQKEIALRLALGASRSRLIRQLLTESALLAIAGGVLGLLFAMWAIDLMLAMGTARVLRLGDVGMSLKVLGFTMAISIVTGLVFGLAPALQATKPDLNESLKEAGRSSTGGAGRQRARSLVVISEVALSLVLLVGAGLMIKSFLKLQQVETGFDPENVLTAQLSLPFAKYREPHQITSFYSQLVERVEALPGVRSAALVSRLPLAGDRSTISVTIEGRPIEVGKLPEAHFRVITPDYFRAMGIALIDGRELNERDTQTTPAAVIINEKAARDFWPGEDAVGKRVKVGSNPQNSWASIVGVVKDARHFGLDAEARPELYLSYLQTTQSRMRLVVRTASDSLSSTAAVKGVVYSIDKDLPISQVATLDQLLAESIAQRRLTMILLGSFAGVALLLAAIGLYGVISYSVSQRTREIGIRMALGAQTRQVVRLVLGQGLKLALIGIGIGLACAFVVTRALTSLLFGVSPTDPVTFAIVAAALTGVALLATYIPARRASKVDPMVALRHE